MTSKLTIEQLAQSIEKSSQGNLGRNGRIFIDEYMMRNFVNESELEDERRSMRTFEDKFRQPEDVVEGELFETRHSGIRGDFRDDISEEVCTCEDGQSCSLHYTTRDLVAHPGLLQLVREKKVRLSRTDPKLLGDFNVIVPLDLAMTMGLIKID